jgi:hypothetical protein
MAKKSGRKAMFDRKSHGGLNATKTGGRSQRKKGGMLESDVSGSDLMGSSSKGGMGGKSPSVSTPAMAASRAGRIATAGQARGGPRQMSSETATPKGGTAAK